MARLELPHDRRRKERRILVFCGLVTIALMLGVCWLAMVATRWVGVGP